MDGWIDRCVLGSSSNPNRFVVSLLLLCICICICNMRLVYLIMGILSLQGPAILAGQIVLGLNKAYNVRQPSIRNRPLVS